MSADLRSAALSMLAAHYDCDADGEIGKLASVLALEAARCMEHMGLKAIEGKMEMEDGAVVKFVMKLVLAEEN